MQRRWVSDWPVNTAGEAVRTLRRLVNEPPSSRQVYHLCRRGDLRFPTVASSLVAQYATHCASVQGWREDHAGEMLARRHPAPVIFDTSSGSPPEFVLPPAVLQRY